MRPIKYTILKLKGKGTMETKKLMKIMLFSVAVFITTLYAPKTTTPTYMTDVVSYWKSTAETATIAWDRPACTDDETTNNCPVGYHVQLLWLQADKVLQVYDKGTTTDTQMVVSAPRAGIFLIRINAYNDAGASTWANSNDPAYATVNGTSRAWMLIFYVASPGPIIIQ